MSESEIKKEIEAVVDKWVDEVLKTRLVFSNDSDSDSHQDKNLWNRFKSGVSKGLSNLWYGRDSKKNPYYWQNRLGKFGVFECLQLSEYIELKTIIENTEVLLNEAQEETEKLKIVKILRSAADNLKQRLFKMIMRLNAEGSPPPPATVATGPAPAGSSSSATGTGPVGSLPPATVVTGSSSPATASGKPSKAARTKPAAAAGTKPTPASAGSAKLPPPSSSQSSSSSSSSSAPSSVGSAGSSSTSSAKSSPSAVPDHKAKILKRLYRDQKGELDVEATSAKKDAKGEAENDAGDAAAGDSIIQRIEQKLIKPCEKQLDNPKLHDARERLRQWWSNLKKDVKNKIVSKSELIKDIKQGRLIFVIAQIINPKKDFQDKVFEILKSEVEKDPKLKKEMEDEDEIDHVGF